MTRITRRGLVLAGGALVAAPASAHNNPTLREQQFLTLNVSPTPLDSDGRCTPPFALDPPKRTVEYLWHVTGGAPDGIRFEPLSGRINWIHSVSLARSGTARSRERARRGRA